jgi:hypothetical protein
MHTDYINGIRYDEAKVGNVCLSLAKKSELSWHEAYKIIISLWLAQIKFDFSSPFNCLKDNRIDYEIVLIHVEEQSLSH